MATKKISELAALTTPVPSIDYFAIVNAGATKRMLLRYVLAGGTEAITGLTALTAPAPDADFLVISDVSGSINKKIIVSDLFRGAGGIQTNVMVGHDAGSSNTTGAYNSFFGQAAGTANTTGASNSFFGRYAGYANTTGSYNSFFGHDAGSSNTTGASNSFFGTAAGTANTTGSYNSFFGWYAGTANTTGTSNSFFGRTAGAANTTGSENSFFGLSAGRFNTEGAYNSFFGHSAGSSNTTGTNLTCVGYNAQASAVDATNEVTLGNSGVTTLRCNTQTITALSDRRDKTDIEPIPLGLDFIRDLKPSRWIWNCRDGSRVGDEDTGFVAQDLDDSQKKFGYEIPGLVFKPNDDRWEASSGKLLTVAIKAIQELAAKVDMLEAQIDA